MNWPCQQAHCTTCRKATATAWRRQVRDIYGQPSDPVDFPCPLGKQIVGKSLGEPADCPSDIIWCNRYGLPIGPGGCVACVAARQPDSSDPDLAVWFSQAMRDLGNAYGALDCPHRYTDNQTETVRCCGGQVRTINRFFCRLTGRPANCHHCPSRCTLISENQSLKP